MTLYDVLGVSPGASGEELRRAFVSMARQHHPDRHIGADDATRSRAERRMREVNDAWAVLGDPDRRRRYDVSLSDRGTGSWSDPTAGARSSTTVPPRYESEQLRDWRSYASPGSGAAERKPVWEQLALMSPVLLLLAAGLLGGAAALVGWEGFYAAALVCLILAGSAFFMLPIWAMARTGRRRKRPGRRPAGGR